MRVLLLADRRRYYPNPTRQLLVAALAREPEVVLHGPGYTELLATVAELEARHGRFDVVACDSVFFFHHGRPGQRQRAYTRLGHDAWPADLFSCGRPLLVLNLLDDVHGGSEANFTRIATSGAFVLSTATSAAFLVQPDEAVYRGAPWLSRDAHVFRHPEVIGPRYLLFPHCVAPEEFRAPTRSAPRFDVSVLGARYEFRTTVIALLERHPEIRLARPDALHKVLGLAVARYGLMGRLYKKRFEDWIHASLLSITCDGSVGYPIRKFFEIPSCGSILAAQFFKNPQALGFRDGENCFVLNGAPPERVLDLVFMLRGDPQRARAIAHAGQEMVRARHSVAVRVGQFLEVARAVGKGSLVSTEWEDGRQRLVSAP